MQVASRPHNEADRLRVLRALDVLDTPPEAAFDDLTKLAAHATNRPTALVSLVDVDRQWFKSKWGLDADETPRDVAFCAHAILEPEQVMVVPDALDDDRFHDNPLVTGEPHIRFYAGAPLVTANGEALGTLCVLDSEPGEMSQADIEALQALARRAVAQLELRQAADARLRVDYADALHQITVLESNAVRLAAERAALRAEHDFREALIDHVSEGVSVCNAVAAHPSIEFSVWNKRMTEITGYGQAEINRLGWFQCLYADAQRRAEAAQQLEQAFTGEPMPDTRSQISRPDGSTRVISITMTRLIGVDGRDHVLVLVSDITDNERFEREAVFGRLDQLTGLRTRPAFREDAELIFRLASRSSTPSALAFLDLDDLKVVNDSMGHLAGDRMLQCVGETLLASTRSTDVTGRLGGDEFAVLLSDTAVESAMAYFDRLHQRLSSALRRRGFPSGVSIGVALFPEEPPSFDVALSEADHLMYRAKRSGKDRVVHAQFPATSQPLPRRAAGTC